MAAQPYASLRWGAILAFALFAPVALPAGGGERRQAEIRRRCASDPFFSTTKGCLQASQSARLLSWPRSLWILRLRC